MYASVNRATTFKIVPDFSVARSEEGTTQPNISVVIPVLFENAISNFLLLLIRGPL